MPFCRKFIELRELLLCLIFCLPIISSHLNALDNSFRRPVELVNNAYTQEDQTLVLAYKSAIRLYEIYNQKFEDNSKDCCYCIEKGKFLKFRESCDEMVRERENAFIFLSKGEVLGTRLKKKPIFRSTTEDIVVKIFPDGSYIRGKVLTVGDGYAEYDGVYVKNSHHYYNGRLRDNSTEILYNGPGIEYIKGQICTTTWRNGNMQEIGQYQKVADPPPPPPRLQEIPSCNEARVIHEIITELVNRDKEQKNLHGFISQQKYKPSDSDFYHLLAGNNVSNQHSKYMNSLRSYLNILEGRLEDYNTTFFDMECITMEKLQDSWQSNYLVVMPENPSDELIRVGLVNSLTRARFYLYFVLRENYNASGPSPFWIWFPDLLNDAN